MFVRGNSVLSTLVSQFDASFLVLLAVIAFYFVSTILVRKRVDRLLKADGEVFATTYDIDTVYDAVVKEAEEWRRRSLMSRRFSLNPLKWGIPRFEVYRQTRPRLYRVVGRDAGIITFELAPIDDGGTSVKISYSQRGRIWIDAFKKKLPLKIPPSLGKACPSCRQIYPPSYAYCPHCSIALQ